MDRAVVVTTQQLMRVFERPEDYQEDVVRYMRMAQERGARLIVFPALSPVMLVPPLLSSPRLGLLKEADRGRGRWASLVERVKGRAAEVADQALGGGLRGEMNRLLYRAPEALYEAYVDLFSAVALKYRMAVVAGSFYVRESEDANSKHVSFVFGPNGQIIGRQEKVHLTVEEMSFCQAGEGFEAMETDLGRIGILIGEDALFPEAGRLLAYQKCDLLVNLAACDGPAVFHHIRHGFLARLNENELLGAQSCLVGPNRLTGSGQDFVGKSGLFTPLPMSPRMDGILFEMGGMTAEGFIAEPLDLGAMEQQWRQDRPRLRQGMRMLAYQPLVGVYRGMRTLDQAYYSPDETVEIGPVVVPEPPPARLPQPGEEAQPSMPSQAESEVDAQADTQPRHLDLRGKGNEQKGFDLLASPFEDEDVD